MLGSANPDPRRGQGPRDGGWSAPFLPPPPEVGSANGSALLWTAPPVCRKQSVPARHPLLWVASASAPLPNHLPRRFLRRTSLVRAALTIGANFRRGGSDLRTESSPAGATTDRGYPVVVAVAGGRGGSGRTRLAIEVAAVLAASDFGEARRVLLVDADSSHPDLDLQLGATDWDSDHRPSARSDRIFLQFPELADHRISLDSLLWVDSRSRLRALLAPDRFGAVSREQLDYLYTYFLRPAFDVIVVDTGPDCDGPASQVVASAYWLAMANLVLLPLRPSVSGARAVVEGVRSLEEAGISKDHCRLVMGVSRNEKSEAAGCQRRLGDYVMVRWPWAPELAHRATVDRRPMSERNHDFAKSVAALLPEVAGGPWRRY